MTKFGNTSSPGATLGPQGFASTPGRNATAPRLTASELPKPPHADFKTCPDCAEQVRAAARKCRFCGYEFEVGISHATDR